MFKKLTTAELIQFFTRQTSSWVIKFGFHCETDEDFVRWGEFAKLLAAKFPGHSNEHLTAILCGDLLVFQNSEDATQLFDMICDFNDANGSFGLYAELIDSDGDLRNYVV